MARSRMAAAVLALLSLAGCDFGSEVPAERLPRFVQPTGPAPRLALVLGSMVGALYASGMSAAELERLAYDINLLQFFELGMIAKRPNTGAPIQSYVNEKVHGRTIEELPIAFAAAATRTSDNKLVIFNHGDTGLAVRASSASAPEFTHVHVGSDLLSDSDDMAPVPVRAARALGARFVIAVDVSAFAEDTPAGVPREWVDKDARRAKQVAAEAGEADVMLHPNIGYYAGHDEGYRRRVIAAAERYTREKLPAIRTALARAGFATTAQAGSARTPVGEASR